jgi:two-component system, NarL family, response regulator LiaR
VARVDPIRVMVVDDHEMVRAGLALLVEATSDFELVGVAANGQEAVALCETVQPDVILMDLVMPVMNGVEATIHIRQRYPDIEIIAISYAADSELAHRVLQAGARACYFKDVSADIIIEAIRAAVT